jgi:hypothetical protein
MWDVIKVHVNEVRTVEKDEKAEEDDDKFSTENMRPICKVLLNNYSMSFYFYNSRNV